MINNKKDEKYIKKSVKEIFDLSTLLLDYCKYNSSAEGIDCICTGLSLLNKKADDLNYKFMETE